MAKGRALKIKASDVSTGRMGRVSFPATLITVKVMAVMPGSFDCPGAVVISASLSRGILLKSRQKQGSALLSQPDKGCHRPNFWEGGNLRDPLPWNGLRGPSSPRESFG